MSCVFTANCGIVKREDRKIAELTDLKIVKLLIALARKAKGTPKEAPLTLTLAWATPVARLDRITRTDPLNLWV